jgi:hypothetical protein
VWALAERRVCSRMMTGRLSALVGWCGLLLPCNSGTCQRPPISFAAGASVHGKAALVPADLCADSGERLPANGAERCAPFAEPPLPSLANEGQGQTAPSIGSAVH